MLIIQMITILFCTYFFIYAIRRLNNGYLNSLYVVYLGFYIFLVTPMIADIFIGKPDYSIYYQFNGFSGFQTSSSDFTTNFIYCLVVITSTIILFLFGKKKNILLSELPVINMGKVQKYLSMLCTVIILLPTFLVIKKTVEDHNSVLEIFKYDYLRLLFRGQDNYIQYYYLCLFSVLAFIVYFSITKMRIPIIVALFSVPLYISFGVHGKRNIIGIFLFMFLFAVIFKGKIKKIHIKYLFFFFTLALVSMSVIYQSSIRGINAEESSKRAYTDFRVDFGRDDVTKLAIYGEVMNERILDNKPNTILYVPKTLISKLFDIAPGYKYSVYATARVIGTSFISDLGWGMTTGIYDEFIANYGIVFGCLLANMTLCIVMRLGDRTNSSLCLVLTYIVGLFFIILQLVSFVFIFALWVLMILHSFRGKKVISRHAALKEKQ